MSITKSNCKFSSDYCFKVVMSFLADTPEDLKVIAFLSKQSYEAFKEGLKDIGKLSIYFLPSHTFEILKILPRVEELHLAFKTPERDDNLLEKRSMECLSYLSKLIFLRAVTLYSNSSNINNIDMSATLSYLPTTLQKLDLSGMVPFWQIFRKHRLPRPDCFIPLQKMLSLRSLNLSHCAIENEHLPFFPISLQVLHLSDCSNITDERLPCLKAMTDLRDLNLSCTNTSDLAVSNLCRDLTKLEKLYLSRKFTNRRREDPCLVNLPSSLQVLELPESDVTRHGLQLMRSLHNLRSLNLAACAKIVDTDLEYLPHGLLHLNISCCQRISDEAIPLLPKTLESLEIQGRPSKKCTITGKTFSSLPKLKYLDVSRSDVRDEALMNLPVTLIKLDISFCERITDCGLFYLQQYINANMDILYLKSIPLQLLHDPILHPISLRWLNIRGCQTTNIGLGYLQRFPLENF